mgnify:CR=1 FL=1
MKTTIERQTFRGRATAVLLLLTSAALFAGCSAADPQPSDAAAQAETTPAIKVEEVGKASMGDPREQIADVAPVSRSDIYVESGGVLVKLLKRNGERVKAGEVIAEFDSKNARIERERAAAALKSAESALASTSADLSANRLQLTNTVERLKELLKKQTMENAPAEEAEETRRSLQASMKQLDALNGSASISALEAQVEAAKLTLEQAESAWNGGKLVAPANGVLTDVKADEGATVQPGSAFGVVQNTDKVKLKARLSEAAAELVQGKKELVFTTSDDEDRLRQATVVHLAEVPDVATKLISLELEADNGDRSLKISSRVQLQLTTPDEENVVAVPSLSVLREGRDTFVFVLNGNKAEKRKVRLGRVNGPYQEVLQGLGVGDRLIVSGQQALEDGQTVEQ